MDIYVAKRGFVTMHNGQRATVHEGETTVEGHWLLEQCADAFEPLEITHPLVTTPPWRDDQPPPAKPSRRAKAAAR